MCMYCVRCAIFGQVWCWLHYHCSVHFNVLISERSMGTSKHSMQSAFAAVRVYGYRTLVHAYTRTAAKAAARCLLVIC
jgi:hypothetical protein